jgi:tocopherol cyclase
MILNPKYHIWIQTNHFEQPRSSLMVSVANVPWMGNSFNGFIMGFWYNNRLYSFTTYTGARIIGIHYDKEKLVLRVQSKIYRLEIEVFYLKGTELLTPVIGDMMGRLSESLSASTHLKLLKLDKESDILIFEGTGRHTGLEIEGELPSSLFKQQIAHEI